MMIKRVFRLSPNYYAFLSGVMVSGAVNFYTAIALEKALWCQRPSVLIGSLVLLLSGVLWAVLAAEMGRIRESAVEKAPRFIDKENVLSALINERIRLLNGLLLGATLTGLSGLAVASL